MTALRLLRMSNRTAVACWLANPLSLRAIFVGLVSWGYDWVRRSVTESQRKRQMQSGGGAGIRDYLSIRKPPLSYTQGMRWLKGGGGLLEGIRSYVEDRAAANDQLVFYNKAQIFQAMRNEGGNIFSRDFLSATADSNPYELFTGNGLWDRVDISITRLICDTYLLGNGINQADRLSMASSVECRLPLVDYKLVELVIGLRKTASGAGLPIPLSFVPLRRTCVTETIRRGKKFIPSLPRLFRGVGWLGDESDEAVGLVRIWDQHLVVDESSRQTDS